MNVNTKKKINIAFRALIFLCAALSALMIFSMIRFALIMDQNDNGLVGDFMSATKMFSMLYMVLFGLSIVCFFISIFGRYRCSAAGYIVRTIFIGVVVFSMGIGLQMANAMYKATKVLEEIGKVDLNITENDLIGAGIDPDEARRLSDILTGDGAIVAFVVGMSLCIVVYTVLTFTSLHNLIKKDKEQKEQITE
ncbi:MAG: hypothetical protein IJH80_07560 [Ruminococcus sp.]|nr:hypothetical protein [Ruminococcus sp.]